MNELTTKNELLDEISARLPTVTNEYEEVLYYERLSSNLSAAAEKYLKLAEDLKKRIRAAQTETKVVSTRYEVIPKFSTRKETRIFEAELKADNPELYKKCLTIKASEAEKLIGKDKLLKMCFKEAGEERTTLACNLTLGRMREVMTSEEFERYTQEVYNEVGLQVITKGD
jgi:hypothetical protein